MVNKQDSYWMEFTLDEKVDQKVCEYLREYHAEYRNTKQKIKELMERYPNVQAVFETEDVITLTVEEHEILHTYFQLESGAELIEREYHFYMGQSMMFSYGSMFAKLKKEIMNPEEGETGRLLDFFMETRTDELEKELRTQNQQYREALDEIKKYEEEIQKLNLPKTVRVQIDCYVSAVNWRWVLCWDFLYRSGMKDMQNARIAMDQEQYQKEFDELVERHSRVKQEYEEQAIAAEQDVGRGAQIDYFISPLEELNAPVTEFDEQLWISMVDHVVVHSKEDIRRWY